MKPFNPEDLQFKIEYVPAKEVINTEGRFMTPSELRVELTNPTQHDIAWIEIGLIGGIYSRKVQVFYNPGRYSSSPDVRVSHTSRPREVSNFYSGYKGVEYYAAKHKITLRSIPSGQTVRFNETYNPENNLTNPFSDSDAGFIVPGSVFGVLQNNQQFSKQFYRIPGPDYTHTMCFVVTAACGDEKHPMVQTFRKLRDQILVKTKAGHSFIRWYNQHGPSYARQLHTYPLLKPVVRTALRPAYWLTLGVLGLRKWLH